MQDDLNKVNKKRAIVVSASLIGYAVIIIILAVLFSKELSVYLGTPDKFRAWIDTFGFMGKLVFVALTIIQVVLAVVHDGPMQIAGGYAFGALNGALLFTLGMALGSAIAFVLSRCFGKMILSLFYSKEKYEKFFSVIEGRNLYVLTFLLYLVPGTPKDMLTYCFGTTKINPWLFVFLISVARFPTILLTILIAQNLISKNIIMLLSVLSVLALMYFIGYLILKRLKKPKSN